MSVKDVEVKFKKLNKDAVTPSYKYDGDAGFDLTLVEDLEIEPYGKGLGKTGLAFSIPKGYEAQIRPRSGISLKGLEVICTDAEIVLITNSIDVILGTVDSNYRGEVGIITKNNSEYKVTIPKGTRLAQMIVAPVVKILPREVDELDGSERQEKGYGSTGVK